LVGGPCLIIFKRAYRDFPGIPVGQYVPEYSISVFEVDNKQLSGKIKLIKNIPDVPIGSTSKTIFSWIDFLNQNR
jgi:hypothetical protein